MYNQLDLFVKTPKERYKEFYDNFYKGVKERYEREMREEQSSKHERISIRIKAKKNG